MSTRNSLIGCLHTMATLFDQNRHPRLIITCNPQGNYYTLLTPVEHQTQRENVNKRNYRTVLNITKNELAQVLKTPQLKLPLD